MLQRNLLYTGVTRGKRLVVLVGDLETVTVLGKTQITGSVLPFSHQLAEEALASIKQVRKKARAEAVKLSRSLGRNVDDNAFGLVAGVEEVLAGSAFMFSNLWLDDVLRRALNPSLPHMRNTDGEPLEFITVHFQRPLNRDVCGLGRLEADFVDTRIHGREVSARSSSARSPTLCLLSAGLAPSNSPTYAPATGCISRIKTSVQR
jgi:hypothetical protein